MPTINLKKVGSLLKVVISGSATSDKTIFESTNSERISFKPLTDGRIAVRINNDQLVLDAITDIQFDETPAADLQDFEIKLALLFPNANSGNGGSGIDYKKYSCQIFQSGANNPYDNAQGTQTLGDGFIQYVRNATGIYSGYLSGDVPFTNQNLIKFIYSSHTIDDKIVKVAYVDQNNISIVQTDLEGQTIDGITRLDLTIEVYDTNSYND